MGELLDIGVVAATSGLAPSALRYYEQQGLIRSAGRDGLRRQYEPRTLERLAVIVMCRDVGFSIAETAQLMGTRGRPAWKDITRRKLSELRTQIEHAQAVAERLEHALRCPSPNVLDCEHFQSAVSAVFAAAGPGTESVPEPAS